MKGYEKINNQFEFDIKTRTRRCSFTCYFHLLFIVQLLNINLLIVLAFV